MDTQSVLAKQEAVQGTIVAGIAVAVDIAVAVETHDAWIQHPLR